MMLTLLVIGMWVMVLALAAFFIFVVAPLGSVLEEVPRMLVSAIQAAIAISAIVLFVFGLGRLKRVYMARKLPSRA